MSTLFISDLHLEDSRPRATEILTGFLRRQARDAEALYILGDLFESWIGDDAVSDTAAHVADELAHLTGLGVPCSFQHGNRDFLLGKKYADRAGLHLMPETLVVDLYGTPTLLLHGDALCTDDAAYQAFRQQVRNPEFQAMFLQMPVERRLEMARTARDASRSHTSRAPMDIMDVNADAVGAAFAEHGVTHMIHGHTHRPAFHQHTLENGKTAERLVLADWYESGSFLQVGPEGCQHVPIKLES